MQSIPNVLLSEVYEAAEADQREDQVKVARRMIVHLLHEAETQLRKIDQLAGDLSVAQKRHVETVARLARIKQGDWQGIPEPKIEKSEKEKSEKVL